MVQFFKIECVHHKNKDSVVILYIPGCEVGFGLCTDSINICFLADFMDEWLEVLTGTCFNRRIPPTNEWSFTFMTSISTKYFLDPYPLYIGIKKEMRDFDDHQYNLIWIT